jgi:phytoene/squalene synthetase
MNPSIEAPDRAPFHADTRLAKAYRTNDRMINQHSRTFHFATAFLAPRERRAIRSL